MDDIQKVEQALAAAIEAGDKELANEYADLLEALVAQPQGAQDFGAMNAVRQGLQQGATFGFSDEISAAARAGMDKLYAGVTGDDTWTGDQSFGDLYEMYRDSEREQLAGGREHHGGKMFAAELLPSLVQGGAGLTKIAGGAGAGGIRAGLDAAGEATLKQLMGRSAGVGAGYGAVAGLGYGEGEGVGGMAADTATGAAMGGALGGLLPAAGAGIRRGYQGAKRRLALGTAEESAQAAAYRDIVNAMKDDGIDPATIARRMADDPHGQAMLLDMGPHLTRAAAIIKRQPGEGGRRIAENVTRRQEATPQRLRESIRGFTEEAGGEGWKAPENFARAERAIMDRARNQARDEDLWSLAYRDDYVAPRSMLNFLARNSKGKIKDPDARAAYNSAIRNLKKRVRGGELTIEEASMPARVHDQVLRALKSRIQLQRNPTSRIARTSEETTVAVREHKRLLGDYAKNAPDEWKRARALWAGEAANEEAYQAGRRVFLDHADEISLRLDDMAQSERDHYLIGALREIERRLGSKGDTTDILRQLRGTQNGRDLMRELAGSESNFRKFMDNAARELNYLQSFKRVTQGSDTFENLMGDALAKGGERGNLAGIVAQQNVGFLRGIAGIPMMARGLGRRGAAWMARHDETKRNKMADMLLSRNPDQFLDLMQKPQWANPNLLTTAGLAGATQLPGLLE